MKTLRILFAASVSLAAFSALQADNSFGRQWMDTYYQNPRPDDLLAAVNSLNDSGYFDSAAQRNTAVGFISMVFQQNPQNVDQWLRDGDKQLSDQPRRILAAAAWLAGSPGAARQLRALSFGTSSRYDVAQMVASGSQPVVGDIPVHSEAAMNLQWGAFLVTGEPLYISNVFAALGSDQPGLATSARYALAEEAATNPRVMEICQHELQRQPTAVAAEFRATLDQVSAQRPGA